jgi:hypothetical protein
MLYIFFLEINGTTMLHKLLEPVDEIYLGDVFIYKILNNEYTAKDVALSSMKEKLKHFIPESFDKDLESMSLKEIEDIKLSKDKDQYLKSNGNIAYIKLYHSLKQLIISNTDIFMKTIWDTTNITSKVYKINEYTFKYNLIKDVIEIDFGDVDISLVKQINNIIEITPQTSTSEIDSKIELTEQDIEKIKEENKLLCNTEIDWVFDYLESINIEDTPEPEIKVTTSPMQPSLEMSPTSPVLEPLEMTSETEDMMSNNSPDLFGSDSELESESELEPDSELESDSELMPVVETPVSSFEFSFSNKQSKECHKCGSTIKTFSTFRKDQPPKIWCVECLEKIENF